MKVERLRLCSSYAMAIASKAGVEACVSSSEARDGVRHRLCTTGLLRDRGASRRTGVHATIQFEARVLHECHDTMAGRQCEHMAVGRSCAGRRRCLRLDNGSTIAGHKLQERPASTPAAPSSSAHPTAKPYQWHGACPRSGLRNFRRLHGLLQCRGTRQPRFLQST